MRLLCVICGLLTSLSVCECGNPDCFSIPVRDLALRAGVVLEGVLEESPEKPGYETEPFRVDGVTRETREPDPGAELHQNRIRVHRVWEIKTGGLRKDAVAFLTWSRENTCFRMKAGTRYVFFTEPTGDASVLRALSPPVQSKRAVRKDISHALCQACVHSPDSTEATSTRFSMSGKGDKGRKRDKGESRKDKKSDVTDIPKLKELTNKQANEGQKLTLKCELLAGGRQTKIQWYLNGKKIGKNETRKIKLKKKGLLSELQLTKVTDADVGKYTCTAVNERGEDSQDAIVQIINGARCPPIRAYLSHAALETRERDPPQAAQCVCLLRPPLFIDFVVFSFYHKLPKEQRAKKGEKKQLIVMEAAGVEDSSDKLGAPENSTSAVDPSSEDLSEACPEEALEEVKLEEEKLEEEEEVVVDENRENQGLLGCLGLTAASCCVCMELEQVRNCVRSEKICILPILACLLSLALCTAGLKWVFVDKIFEYEPPTHLDPKPIGQDPIIIDADSTMGLPVSFSHPTSPRAPVPAATTKIPARPEVFVEDDSTAGPFAPASPKVTRFMPTSKVTTRLNPASRPTPRAPSEPGRNNTPSQHESNNIVTKTSPISTTASAKTSSHMMRCKEEDRSYCVNGGECLTVNVTPNSTKHLCRCPNEFTGDRCQNYVMASFYKAEELYQKRILTITGICIALLVVGIMCVVAYCKTKKQRQKLHDRLRQSLRKRNAMADMGNGSQYPHNLHQPPQSLQLVDQYTSKNTAPAEHVIEKETETSFTLSQYTSPTQPPTAVTASLSQCWSNKKPENVMSDTRTISGAQNSRNGTPSHRGRLNATGGARDVNTYVKNSRETTDSYKDSPYSERFVSTVTTPTRLSPVKLLSPATPSSPPSEMSAPLPSLATSIPSMATSPLGEEERPLLFLTPPRLREKSESNRAQQLRNSAHYNHGLDEMSPPPSPLHTKEDEQHESMQEDNSVPCAQPTTATHSPTAMHNSKRTKAGSQNSQDEQSGSSSESSSSESEAEEERMAEDTPFLIQNAGVAGMAVLGLELVDSSRTNTALRLSPQDDLQSRLASVMANQDPIAV
ncbi:hypothetical protein QTP86_025214 [Hemibagrus guttatus]|nr:hypothetical protein QTP86_025214 [Hemibagrus guttatus]